MASKQRSRTTAHSRVEDTRRRTTLPARSLRKNLLTDTAASGANAANPTLCAPPPEHFFMTLRDIGLWVRSAQADAAVARHAAGGDVAQAFEALYRNNPDPYGAADPRYRYQARKQGMLLSFMPARHYHHVLDLGCGIGALCRALAPYAETITGIDVAAAAVRRATSLSQGHLNLVFRQGDIRSFDPAGRRYDLIVVADVLYYAVPRDDEFALEAIARRIAACTEPGGLVLLADHYFLGFDAASRRTRAIHNVFRRTPGLQLRTEHRRCFYLATLLQRAG